MNILSFHTLANQLQSVSLPQIYVPLLIPLCNLLHWKLSLFKLFIHLVTHFETLQTDTWSYDSMQILRVHSEVLLQHIYILLNNPLHSSFPSCMYGRNHFFPFVVHQYGNAVGSLHANTHILLIGCKCIYSVQQHDLFQLSFL